MPQTYEEQVAELTTASNLLTSAIENKVDEIDIRLTEKENDVDNTLSNLFLDSRFGIQPPFDGVRIDDVPNIAGVFILPVFIFDVSNISGFASGSFVIDLFATGAPNTDESWFRQVHLSYKQQHLSFNYNAKCLEQSGLGSGIVSLTYEPNGGQFGAGQLKLWVSSGNFYNTIAAVARGLAIAHDPLKGADYNNRGALYFRNENAVLAGSAEHDAIKLLPNYIELDL
jgi:hypothetical protein